MNRSLKLVLGGLAKGMGMQSILEERELISLEDSYKRFFYKKFGKNPVFDRLDRERLRKLLKHTGDFDEVHDALEHYFSMKDLWFETKCFDLETFEKSFNKVLADMGLLERAQATREHVKLMNEVDRMMILYKISREEARKKLHLNPDGSDDWQVTPPFEKVSQ